MRVKIFIDFWNFQLGWNHFHRHNDDLVRIPWNLGLPECLVGHVGGSAVYAGTHVYASYNPATEKGRKLRGFLHAMDGFPGYVVTAKKRKPSGPVCCPNEGCRREVTQCPHCEKTMSRTVEKGVDSALVTDLVTMGVDDLYDRAVLVSGDTDFVPGVDYLGSKMKQVTHVWFRGQSNELRNACWDHALLDDLMPALLPGDAGS